MTVDCVCLSDVASLVFRTEKELERFTALEFSNYSIPDTGLSIRVDPGVFESVDAEVPSVEHVPATDVAPALDVQTSSTPTGGDGDAVIMADVIGSVRRADCRAGLVAFLLGGSPGWRGWMDGVAQVFAPKTRRSRSDSWPARIAEAATGGAAAPIDRDGVLLTAASDVLMKYPVEQGWPAAQVLGDITELAKTRAGALDEGADREIAVWSQRATDVLASKAEPQSMADDKFVLKRAILLLLLRGDLDAIADGLGAVEGRHRPGPQVLGTASALAAFRTGLRALPARYKTCSDSAAAGRWLAYLGEAFVGMLATGDSRSLLPHSLPRPTLRYRGVRTLQGEWVAAVSGREIRRTAADFDRGLERLLTLGRHLGFEFEEHGDNGLVAPVHLADGRTRPVYFELIRASHPDGPMVRFSSPAFEIKGMGARSVTREVMLELLKRNADPEMNCRFAVTEDPITVVVLVDQLFSTLDEAEFKQHIQHVAEVAEEFRLSRSVGTVTAESIPD